MVAVKTIASVEEKKISRSADRLGVTRIESCWKKIFFYSAKQSRDQDYEGLYQIFRDALREIFVFLVILMGKIYITPNVSSVVHITP